MSGSTLKNTKINHFFASCRPRQWTKNLLCFSAFFITPFSSVSNIYKLIFATISFVLASSFIYIINDLIDKNLDKQHPTKKLRPIASGKLKIWQCLIFSFILLTFSILISSLIDIKIFLLIISYICLQLIYCFWAKNKSLLDIFFIASGFIIRACAGVLSINSSPSPWFLTTAVCFALFLVVMLTL